MPNKDKNIPKRRFKAFENADAWELRRFSELAEIRRGLTYSPTSIRKEGIRVLRSSNIDEDTFTFGEDDVFVDKGVVKIPLVKEGDILITAANGSSRLVGKHTIIKGLPANSTVHGGFMLLASCRNPEFVNSLMSSEWYNKFISLYVAGGNGAIGNLNKNDLDNQLVVVPSTSEQSAIGTFFSTLDQQITLHQRKLDKLKNVKQAYLSEMFPAEGERVPKRRFPGFTDAWELRKVGEICSISTGKSNTQDRDEQGKFPFYVRSPIIEKSTKYLFDEEAVLTVGDGVGTGKVFHYVNGKYDLHQRVYRMFSFTHVNAKYFYYYFSKKFFDRVMAMTAKNSVDSVRLEMISDMEITFPQLEEQEKIVKVLSTLDQQITLHQRKLEKLKNLKKALLNELFV
ncbi:restriction endonuclease subunit S [Streptococcus suis]